MNTLTLNRRSPRVLTRLALGLVLSLAVIGQASAASIDLETFVDTESHEYLPPFPALDLESISTATVSASVVNRITTDFAAEGEVELSITLSAPGGIAVDFPTGGYFTVRFKAGNSFVVAGNFNDNSPTLTLDGFTGDALPAPSTLAISMTGPPMDIFNPNRYDFIATYNLPGPTSFSFDSFTFSTTIPAGYAMDFSSGSGVAEASFQGRIDGLASSPGQFVYLVPEPASAALLGLGGFVLLRRRV